MKKARDLFETIPYILDGCPEENENYLRDYLRTDQSLHRMNCYKWAMDEKLWSAMQETISHVSPYNFKSSFSLMTKSSKSINPLSATRMFATATANQPEYIQIKIGISNILINSCIKFSN